MSIGVISPFSPLCQFTYLQPSLVTAASSEILVSENPMRTEEKTDQTTEEQITSNFFFSIETVTNKLMEEQYPVQQSLMYLWQVWHQVHLYSQSQVWHYDTSGMQVVEETSMRMNKIIFQHSETIFVTTWQSKLMIIDD